MVFANLFSSLSAVKDKDADMPRASTYSNTSDQRRRGEPWKRKTQWEQGGTFPKKQRYQDGKPSKNHDFTTQCHNVPKTDGTCQSVPFSKHTWNNRKDNFGGGSVSQNYTSENKSNDKKGKIQANKKFDRFTNQGVRRKPNRPSFKNNGGHRKHNNRKTGPIQERPRYMTQEFKDQNALEVNGQLLCRHFLKGKCIKGDNCQLKHVQGSNDLIKMPCKFYIQGFCLKGDSCPYMHKSFPCMFFHRRARCLQEANCRFSHDPLNDLTSKLLDEAIQRDRDLHEQAKAAEHRPAGSPVDTEQSDTLDANKLPDLFLQPLRPNFYKNNDDDDKSVEESLTSQTEGLKCELTLDSDKAQQVDSVEAHSPHVAKPESPQPVCYSVEAVLGPQRFKPSTHLFTFSGSKEFVPLSSGSTSNPTTQTQAPYSVDTVLNSFKSAEGSNSGLTRAPYTQTVSFTPIKSGEDACPPKSSPAPCLAKEKNKTQEKCLTSLTLSKDLNSNSWTKPSQAFRDQRQQHRHGWMSSNSDHSAAYKVELDNVSNDMKSCASFKSEGVGFIKQAEKSSALSRARASSKFSTQTADSQSSLKNVSSKFAQRKTISASGAGCNTPLAKCSDSAPEDKNTPTRLFQSLFKTPLTKNLLPAADSISSSSPNGSAESSCPPSKSTPCQNEHVEPQDKAAAAAGSPLSLSAGPADAASVPLLNDNPAGSPEVHRCSNRDKSHSLQAKAEEKSPRNKARRQTAHKCANGPSEHQVEPPDTAALHDGTQKQQSDVSSHKEAAPVKSVLQTLFLCLSPFQQDYGNSATSEREDQSNSHVVRRRQTESGEKRSQKNHSETDAVGKQPTVETPDGRREQETSRHQPRTSAEARGRPTVSGPAGPDCQARRPGRHLLPLGSNTRVTPQAPRHVQPAGRSSAERAARATAAADTTPFRNLFKTFDAAASHTAQ